MLSVNLWLGSLLVSPWFCSTLSSIEFSLTGENELLSRCNLLTSMKFFLFQTSFDVFDLNESSFGMEDVS